MEAQPPSNSRLAGRAVFTTIAAGTLLLAFALRYASLFEPRWYGDEGIFSAVAQNIRHGRMLYSDAWDNKPPLIFFTYAGVQSLFGSGVFELHFAAMVSALLTQVCVIAIGVRLFGATRALIAGLIFALLMGTPVIEGNLAMTETFMILPSSLAVLCYLGSRGRPSGARTPLYLACGVLLGIAAGYKQVAVFDGLAIGLMIWLTDERPLRPLAMLTAGFAAPQAAFAALFLATGAFPQYWYAVIGSLGLYSELGPAAHDPFIRFVGYLPTLLATAWLVHRRGRGEPITDQSFPILWLGFALAGATSSSFPFPHYLQQAAPAFALTLVARPFVQEREDVGRIALAVGGALAAAVVFGQFSFAFEDRRQLDPLDYYRTFASHRYGTMSDLDYDYYFDGNVITVSDIVTYIDNDGGGTTAYAWGELPWIYAAGNLTNPTPYYSSFLGEVLPGAKEKILRDLDAHPPAYIIVSDETYAPFEPLDRFIESHYTLLHQQNDWRLYRLDGIDGRLSPEAAENAY